MAPTVPPPLVRIYVPTPLRECCGGAGELSLTTTSVRSLLTELERKYPALHRSICDETGAVRRHINLFVNTQHIRDLEGLDTRPAAGDLVTIMTAVSGG